LQRTRATEKACTSLLTFETITSKLPARNKDYQRREMRDGADGNSK
jgi:hypothetical protein